MARTQLPGHIGTALCVLITSWWTLWGVEEMFFEGWYEPFEWLYFLLPGAVCLALTLLALTWPRFAGWLLMAVGGAFNALWLWRYQVTQGFRLTAQEALTILGVSGLLVVVGALFLVEGRRRRSIEIVRRPDGWRRWLPYLVVVGIPVLLGAATAVGPAIRVSGRVDDGDCSARLIEGNGVALIWAPSGPGWQSTVGAPSWNQIALYGVSPVGFEGKRHGRGDECDKGRDLGCATAEDMQDTGICRYLSADGTRLTVEPEGRWRLPTTSELVRSLVRHGVNAGCQWDGDLGRQPCAVRPDKGTPLWDPTKPVVGYWSADEVDGYRAYLVSYDGRVVWIRKSRGENFGYRCVRETGVEVGHGEEGGEGRNG